MVHSFCVISHFERYFAYNMQYGRGGVGKGQMSGIFCIHTQILIVAGEPKKTVCTMGPSIHLGHTIHHQKTGRDSSDLNGAGH